MRKPKKQKKPLNDLSRSLIPFDPNQTLTAVVELSKKTWLVAAIIPGVERQPLKKLAADEYELLKLLERWRAEGERAGHKITRIAVAFETGCDGFWLARWLRKRGVEAHVIHAASVAVSREHRRAKTDRLDTEQLMRAFFGWLRGERNHCKMAAIPTSRAPEWVRRFGAFAADAHHCIMVRVITQPNRRMWHECSCTICGLHLDSPSSRPAHQVCRRARNRKGQALAGGATRAILYRSCARRPLGCVWVGTKKRSCQIEQRN
jgi:hypothetical protein